MKTKAVRLYGENDLRLDEFELPELKDNEILAHIISDSVCMSSHKAAELGSKHKRVPAYIAEKPIILGHEFCGKIIEVGEKWSSKFTPGQKFTVQPALNYKGSLDAPGYSYHYIGGSATYIIIPNEVMEMDCLLVYDGNYFFSGSLSEPMSCIIGAFHANYHIPPGTYTHNMGIKEHGNMAILAGVGPMGLGAIDYAIHNHNRKPKRLVVTDIDERRLERAAKIYTVAEAKKNNVELRYVNTSDIENVEDHLLSMTNGEAYDDVYVFTPVSILIKQADFILARDGCLNFFAGPTHAEFSGELDFFKVHYSGTHIAANTGGNTDDMREALDLMAKGVVDPSSMITHVGGLNSVVNTILDLPKIHGGKKLIYTNLDMELTAINDFEDKSKEKPMFEELSNIVISNNGLWCGEAETYLLENCKKI